MFFKCFVSVAGLHFLHFLLLSSASSVSSASLELEEAGKEKEAKGLTDGATRLEAAQEQTQTNKHQKVAKCSTGRNRNMPQT